MKITRYVVLALIAPCTVLAGCFYVDFDLGHNRGGGGACSSDDAGVTDAEVTDAGCPDAEN